MSCKKKYSSGIFCRSIRVLYMHKHIVQGTFQQYSLLHIHSTKVRACVCMYACVFDLRPKHNAVNSFNASVR